MSGRFGDKAEYRHDRPGQNPRLPPREPRDHLTPGSEPLLRLARAVEEIVQTLCKSARTCLWPD